MCLTNFPKKMKSKNDGENPSSSIKVKGASMAEIWEGTAKVWGKNPSWQLDKLGEKHTHTLQKQKGMIFLPPQETRRKLKQSSKLVLTGKGRREKLFEKCMYYSKFIKSIYEAHDFILYGKLLINGIINHHHQYYLLMLLATTSVLQSRATTASTVTPLNSSCAWKLHCSCAVPLASWLGRIVNANWLEGPPASSPSATP